MNRRPHIESRLPNVGTTIFTVMSALAQEEGALNLSQGFPDFDCDARLKSLVEQHMSAGHNQYAPLAGIPSLREVLADKISNWHGHTYDPNREVCITAGATQAIFTAITALVSPGDEVIILEPAYDCYVPALCLAGGRVIRVPLNLEEGDLDISALSEAYHSKVKLIIINTPNNPGGLVFSKEAMEALNKLLANTDTLVLSDEVYEHMVFDDQEHQSVARFPGLAERSLMVSSFGKTYHNTGWKIGYCMGPSYLMEEFLKVHQFNVFCVNRPIQHALADFLSSDDSCWSLSEFYQKKRDRFCAGLKDSRFKIRPSAGTYFQLLEYSDICQENDQEVARDWTRSPGIASIPVSSFYQAAPKGEHYLRFCFAKDDETIDKAVALLNQL